MMGVYASDETNVPDKECPACKTLMVLEEYMKKINIQVCPNCGYPHRSKMMEFYKNNPKKMDFCCAYLEFIDAKYDLKLPRAPNGMLQGRLFPSMRTLHLFDSVRGDELYAIINVSKDKKIYEFRGVYSNPYFAEDVCDRMNDENERRGLKAKAHVECIPLNHPIGSSMFKELA